MLMTKQRVRIHFQKDGDLRMISHRDLARLFERLFRRVGVRLGMSEGFHPKAKLSFPSALSLGIRGLDEILDVEVVEEVVEEEFKARLQSEAPQGLLINSVRTLVEGEKKAQPTRLTYEVSIPDCKRQQVQESIQNLLAQSSFLIDREGRDEPIDVLADLGHLELSESIVRFSLLVTRTASVRPREVLAALGLTDLEDEGYYLTRTAVEIAPLKEQERTVYEKGNAD